MLDSLQGVEAPWGRKGEEGREQNQRRASPTRYPSDATCPDPLCPSFPARVPRGRWEADRCSFSTVQCGNTRLQQYCMMQHTTAHKKHTHAHAHGQRDILVVVVAVADFFCLFFFFSYSHYKRKGQGPIELTKELTNITKILQFVNISSTLSAFMDRAGDPGCVGTVGAGSERCQLGLWNSLIFFFSFPTKVE